MVAARTWDSQRIRHTDAYPCPICRSHDEMPRHQGVRCGGYTVGTLVYCQREQYAGGQTPVIVTSNKDRLYRHRLGGLCKCGQVHAPAGAVPYGAIPRTPTPIRQPGPGKPKGPPGELVDLYNYTRADGSLSFQVCRYRQPDGGKTFRQRRPDGKGGWLWTTDGADLVLYRLPELLAAPADQPVFIVEGEKDVERLAELGLIATCNAAGAGKWRRTDYADAVHGRHLVVLSDNDDAGRAHADDVAGAVRGIAATVKVIALPGLSERGDVSDWLDAGNAPSDLLAWAAVWPEWQPSPEAAKHEAEVPQATNLVSKTATYFAPEQQAARPCRCGQDCCAWRQQVVSASRNRGSRDLLATYIGMDDLFRRREAAGYGVETGFRVSSVYKAKELGCAPGTFTGAAKELAEKGVLAWSVVHRRRGDVRPDGTRYDRPQTHTFMAVPGGPDAALARFVALAPDEERRGGRRVPVMLPACSSCGSAHVTPICEDCGEVQDLTAKSGSAESEFEAGSVGEEPGGDSGFVSRNQTLIPINRSEGELIGPAENAKLPERRCDDSGRTPGCTPGQESPDQCWCLDFDTDPRYEGKDEPPC